MMFTESSIDALFEENLELAKRTLSSLPVAESRTPNIAGLTGWIYEQTIRYCLNAEFKSRHVPIEIKEQVTLRGRAKVDLLVGKFALEIKAVGSFGNDSKYKNHRCWAESKNWTYYYVSRCESHLPYRTEIERIFGQKHVFYINETGEWERLICTIANDRPSQ